MLRDIQRTLSIVLDRATNNHVRHIATFKANNYAHNTDTRAAQI